MIPQIYHGSAPPETHDVIAEHSTLGDGVCLNVYDGFDSIEADFKHVEKLGLKLFLDNGSFERFGDFIHGNLTEEQYASMSAVSAYFKRVTREYEAAVAASMAPANLILTVPEVIGNAGITAEMQARFWPEYLAMAKEHGVAMIMAWQFPRRPWTGTTRPATRPGGSPARIQGGCPGSASRSARSSRGTRTRRTGG